MECKPYMYEATAKYVWMGKRKSLIGHLVVLIVEVVGDLVAVSVYDDTASELAGWDAVAGGTKVENLTESAQPNEPRDRESGSPQYKLRHPAEPPQRTAARRSALATRR